MFSILVSFSISNTYNTYITYHSFNLLFTFILDYKNMVKTNAEKQKEYGE